jgi:hypothetical protein
MTTNIQAKFNALRSLGHTGTQEDMELAFYLENGATSYSLRDAEMQFLAARGFTGKTVVDRWKEYLTSLGYTGTVDEKWVKEALEGFSEDKVIWKDYNIKLD